MYVGIDLGGTNIAVGLVDGKGRILRKESTPTRKERPWTEIVRDMARLTRKVVADAGMSLSEIRTVGIGSPGTVDNARGTVVYSNNIVLHNVPLAAEFQKHIDLPVNLENDANAAAYGEYFACEEKVRSFVFVTLGTGVGGGIILDGKIWRGFNQAGAEIGHQTLIYNGEPCTCGKRGCLEAYASVTALIRQTEEALKKDPATLMHQHTPVTGRTAFDCARQGDQTAIEVRDRYLGYLAEGICSTVNLLQPEVLAIGGGISREGDALLAPVRAYVNRYNFNKHMPQTEIRIAKLFGDAGIVGAAMAAKKNL